MEQNIDISPTIIYRERSRSITLSVDPKAKTYSICFYNTVYRATFFDDDMLVYGTLKTDELAKGMELRE